MSTTFCYEENPNEVDEIPGTEDLWNLHDQFMLVEEWLNSSKKGDSKLIIDIGFCYESDKDTAVFGSTLPPKIAIEVANDKLLLNLSLYPQD